jgi:hypothetical protein
MMKTAEQIMAKRTVFKTELDKKSSHSNELWKKATGKLDEIMKHYGALPDGVQPHINKIFPSAAIYLTVKEELGEKEAFAVVEGGAIKNCEGIAKKLEKLMKLPGFPALFVKLWNPLTKKIFGPNNGFKIHFTRRKRANTEWMSIPARIAGTLQSLVVQN